jgi:hypothetical protein
MPLLNIPSISKGIAASVTLDKPTLFSLSSVLADPYFSIQANVKKCVVEYNSEPANQREILEFDLSQLSPSASFLVSDKARSSFSLERIILEDFDNGTLIIERASLPSGLDITVSG